MIICRCCSSSVRRHGQPQLTGTCTAVISTHSKWKHCPRNSKWVMGRRQCRFLLRAADMHSAYLLRQRDWLAGWVGRWVSVTRRYCIKTAKPAFSTLSWLHHSSFFDTQFQGEPLQWGVKYTGCGKIDDFVRFSTEIAVYLANGAR